LRPKKTGTLTRNELTVAACSALPGFDEAALDSADAGADTLDAAIRAASKPGNLPRLQRVTFTPFDPVRKMSEAAVVDAQGNSTRIVKGPFAAMAIANRSPAVATMVEVLQAFRVLRRRGRNGPHTPHCRGDGDQRSAAQRFGGACHTIDGTGNTYN
jgi:H+-transporting ATPase